VSLVVVGNKIDLKEGGMDHVCEVTREMVSSPSPSTPHISRPPSFICTHDLWWLAGWLAGWLTGWLDGWIGGGVVQEDGEADRGEHLLLRNERKRCHQRGGGLPCPRLGHTLPLPGPRQERVRAPSISASPCKV
jgi:hypothetical protein